MTATARLRERAETIFTQDELPAEFGWIAWLTPSHQRLFAGEFYVAWKSNASESEIVELLDAWQATAELDQSPEVREQIERNRASTRWAPVDEWLSKPKSIA